MERRGAGFSQCNFFSCDLFPLAVLSSRPSPKGRFPMRVQEANLSSVLSCLIGTGFCFPCRLTRERAKTYFLHPSNLKESEDTGFPWSICEKCFCWCPIARFYCLSVSPKCGRILFAVPEKTELPPLPGAGPWSLAKTEGENMCGQLFPYCPFPEEFSFQA